ncbi:mitochondrial import inner membrane translocase subunit TIM17-2-like [Salvia divinorum]
MRQGMGAASRSALFGGVLLALIEGAGIMLNKVMSAPQNLPPMEEAVPNVAGYPGQMPGQPSVSVGGLGEGSSSSSSPSSSSWFGGLFGKKEETTPSDGSKTKVLESFDSPTPPSFEYK